MITRRSLSLVSGAAYSRSYLARARFALHAYKNFLKKSVSQSTQNALKRIEMQKKCLYSFDPLRASCVAQSPSGVAQWNFNTINQIEVPTFSPSLIKIWPIVSEIWAVKAGQTDRQTHTQTETQTDKVCRSLQSTDCDNNNQLVITQYVIIQFM